MGQAVERWVESCRACTLCGRKEPPTPMERALLPEAPWDLVAVDFCGPYGTFGGVYILGMVDYYSRYMLAMPVRSTDFVSVRTCFSVVFDLFGFPGSIKSDNGPPFNSAEYRRYCADRGIKAVFSWPLTPQQNGMAERAMQTIDKAMKAASVEGGDFRASLSSAMKAHNSAVHRITNEVPSDVMFGRRLRRALPLTKSAVVEINDEDVRTRDWQEKQRAKVREDGKRRARETRILIGDKVVLRRAAKRKGETNYDPTEMEVIAKRRSDLTMQAPDGSVIRRNVTFAKKIFDRPEEITQDDVQIEEVQAEETGSIPDPIGDGLTATVVGEESRPKRNVGPPKRLNDYVVKIREIH